MSRGTYGGDLTFPFRESGIAPTGRYINPVIPLSSLRGDRGTRGAEIRGVEPEGCRPRHGSGSQGDPGQAFGESGDRRRLCSGEHDRRSHRVGIADHGLTIGPRDGHAPRHG